MTEPQPEKQALAYRSQVLEAANVGPQSIKRRNPSICTIIAICCLLILSFTFLHPTTFVERVLTPILTSPSIPTPSPSTSTSAFGPASTDLDWIPCGDPRFQCANLSVPLNHLNPRDARTASIAITRYLASNRSADTGTLIFNPGGPGGSGTGSTYRLGPLLDTILQGQYDILGFDPRGINATRPLVTCVANEAAWTALIQLLGSTAPSMHLHDVGIWDAFSQLVAEACGANSGADDVLPYVNTPTVARDIAAIIDALHAERRHRVSYWGFSYGTNLGAIFTGMFPNKLHKIILDGIRSPFDAREIYTWGYTSLASADDVVDGYFDICEQVGPERCPLATGHEGGAKKRVMELFTALYERPFPVFSSNSDGTSTAGLVTFTNYKAFLYTTLYRPVSWRRFADVTLGLLHGNASSVIGTARPRGQALQDHEAGTAVLCTDAVPATNYTLSSWTAYVANMSLLSFVSGDLRALDTLPCRHWHTIPNERWEGSFEDVRLELPVLLVANTYDPATPIDSARRLARAMGTNAVLLEQHSYGHCSVSSASSCTYTAVLDYLLKGQLPKPGTVCAVDDGEYGDYFPQERHASSRNKVREASAMIAGEIGSVMSRP
ncbi:hypothetical protein MMC19_002298 [Ptychographa xylographoides]|nr:hypothetical protein [Ptychographa xylographoides]